MRYLIIFFLLLVSFAAIGQSYNYRHYTVDDGLISSTVYNTFQDSKGFIWFCTDAGVNRFNGKVFEKFSQDEGLSDNEVFQMHEDKKGRIWFLSYNGKLTYYFKNKFYTPANDSLLQKMVCPAGYYKIFEDSRGRLFFSSYKGEIVLLDGVKTVKFDLQYLNGKGPPEGILEIFETGNNENMLFKPEIVASSPDLTLRKYDFKYQVNNPNQYRFIKPGEAYFIGDDGVVYIHNDHEEVIISSALIDINSRLFVDRSKNLWIAKNNIGIMKFSVANGYKESPLVFLPGKIISSVYQDSSMNYWFTTLGDGVFFLPYDYERRVNYNISDGISSNDITAIEADQMGNIWLGFSNGLLNKLSPDKSIEKINLVPSEEKYNRVRKIISDEQNNLWIASDLHISYIPQKSISHFDNSNSMYNGCWKDISINRQTGMHAVANLNGIFQVFQKPDLPWQVTRNEIFPHERSFSVFYSKSGNLYFCNVNGLNLYDGNKITTFHSDDGLLKQRINSMAELDSMIVVATDGYGVYLFRNGKVYLTITTKNGLPSGKCRKVFVEGKKAWIATNRGLSKIVFSDNYNYTIKTFTSADFLLSDDVRDVVVNNYKVYMATDKGLCVMDETDPVRDEKFMPVYFTFLRSGSQTFSVDTNIKLNHTQRSAMIQFIALDYANPDHVEYRYRFKGEKQDWVTTSTNNVEFLHLSPGKYRFELSAASKGKKWSDPATLSFTVLPAWWQTLWFRMMVGLTIIFTSFIITRRFFIYRFRRQQEVFERQHAIESERNRISTDIHDDLGSGLTQIAILSQIAKTDAKISSETYTVIEKVSNIADEMVDKISEIIWAINPSNDSLKNLIAYVHEFARNYFEESSVELHVNIPEQIPDITISSSFRRHVFLIVKETLQNVLKHAGAKKVDITIRIDSSQLIINVYDDGKGINTILLENATGQGIKNLRQRAGLLGAELEIKSLNGTGTVIIFTGNYNAA